MRPTIDTHPELLQKARKKFGDLLDYTGELMKGPASSRLSFAGSTRESMAKACVSRLNMDYRVNAR